MLVDPLTITVGAGLFMRRLEMLVFVDDGEIVVFVEFIDVLLLLIEVVFEEIFDGAVVFVVPPTIKVLELLVPVVEFVALVVLVALVVFVAFVVFTGIRDCFVQTPFMSTYPDKHDPLAETGIFESNLNTV